MRRVPMAALWALVQWALLAASGCVPDAGQSASRIHLVADVVDDLVRANEPMTATQLTALLGGPDHIVHASEFPTFLSGQGKHSVEQIADTMGCIHRGFLWSQGQRRPAQEGPEGTESWNADASFLTCAVWVYAWVEPEEIVLGGIIPERTGVLLSTYFLVREGAVIDAGSVTRSTWALPGAVAASGAATRSR